jgi:hypothetical protein
MFGWGKKKIDISAEKEVIKACGCELIGWDPALLIECKKPENAAMLKEQLKALGWIYSPDKGDEELNWVQFRKQEDINAPTWIKK